MARNMSKNLRDRLICRSTVWSDRKREPDTGHAADQGFIRLLMVIALPVLACATTAQAAPVGGQVTAGSGTITQSGSTTTITQTSQNLSLTWGGFNTLPQETVNFVQPSVTAIAVNRIFDTNGTQFLGNLNANGQVYLINPNGILFGAGAQVNVGGLIASTLDFNDADLNGNKRFFRGNGEGSVINQGTINAVNGGYVAMLGNTVRNQGVISAQLGSVALGAGSATTLTFQNNRLLQMQVDQSVLNSLANNGGLIQADGGTVLMSAGAKDSLLASVVNNTGVIRARTVENRNGTIVLLGGMEAGTTQVGGTLDASAPDGGNGGFIETSAAHVKVAEDASITTAAPRGSSGTWLIDPVDFTIAASGGDMTGATLSSNLGGGNVIIQSTTGATGTAGDVNVNDVVSWSTNKLTLNAQNNININANLNASGTGQLALEYGQSSTAGTGSSYTFNNGAKINLPAGNNFSTKQGSTGTTYVYTVITSLGSAGSVTGTDLQGISGGITARYVLGADIDASATSGWNAGAGFAPVGSRVANSCASNTCFSGTFDGLGHTITGLTINRTTQDTGLFGATSTAGVIRNVGLVGGTVKSTSSTTGSLVGWNDGNVLNSHASTAVDGWVNTGGLVGGGGGTISNSHATGTVKGTIYTGGLLGYTFSGGIFNSYSTGTVTASNTGAGGLVGYMLNGAKVQNSYSTSTVNSTGASVGGIVGYWQSDGGSISNSYATGAVTGTSNVGGLVGNKTGTNPATITNSYATGAVTGTSNMGGLVGAASAGTTINNSFWDTTTTGRNSSAGGGTGMTTVQMQTQANFTSATAANGSVNPNWDFSTVWRMYDGHTAPLLKSFMTAATVTANNASKTYDTSGWSGGNGITCSTGACSGLYLGSVSYGGSAQGAVNAGSYTLTPSGLYSNQLGYDISYANGTLTVNPASLNVTGVSAGNRVYDATLAAVLGGSATVTALGGDAVFVSGTGVGVFADKNVGLGKAITVSGFTLSGADAGNYSLVQPTGLAADITVANLAVTGVTADDKTYDGSTSATLGGTAAVAALGSDVVTVGGTGSGVFVDPAIGKGIAVTVSGFTLSGADAGNYALLQPVGITADINPRPSLPESADKVTEAAQQVLAKENAGAEEFNASSTITVIHRSSDNPVPGEDTFSLRSGKQNTVELRKLTGAPQNDGPILQIVDGGVKLLINPHDQYAGAGLLR